MAIPLNPYSRTSPHSRSIFSSGKTWRILSPPISAQQLPTSISLQSRIVSTRLLLRKSRTTSFCSPTYSVLTSNRHSLTLLLRHPTKISLSTVATLATFRSSICLLRRQARPSRSPSPSPLHPLLWFPITIIWLSHPNRDPIP